MTRRGFGWPDLAGLLVIAVLAWATSWVIRHMPEGSPPLPVRNVRAVVPLR